MRNIQQTLFAFALTVVLIVTLVLGYIAFTNPEKLFGNLARTEVLHEMQELQVEAGPSIEEMNENFAYNMSLFENGGMTDLLSENNLEIAFIPTRKTYVELHAHEGEDIQYVPGPQYDVIIVSGGNFEFSNPLLYERKLTEKDLDEFAKQLSYRISLVSGAMKTVQNLIAEKKVSDKISRYVVSDEEIGLMHFVTDCEDGESCQFELNIKDGTATIMGP